MAEIGLSIKLHLKNKNWQSFHFNFPLIPFTEALTQMSVTAFSELDFAIKFKQFAYTTGNYTTTECQSSHKHFKQSRPQTNKANSELTF